LPHEAVLLKMVKVFLGGGMAVADFNKKIGQKE